MVQQSHTDIGSRQGQVARSLPTITDAVSPWTPKIWASIQHFVKNTARELQTCFIYKTNRQIVDSA